jgi:hypothetical protein
MKNIIRSCVVPGVAAVALLGAGVVSAAVNGVLGDARQIPRPASVEPGAFPPADAIHINAFNERENFRLPADVVVDLSPDGGPVEIPEDTCVSMEYIDYDPGSTDAARGSVRFERRILGVIISDPGLDATNLLGAPGGVTYPSGLDCEAAGNGGECGLEDGVDVLTVRRQEVELDLQANLVGDRVRVFTEGDCN